jgi:hypothetical protein
MVLAHVFVRKKRSLYPTMLRSVPREDQNSLLQLELMEMVDETPYKFRISTSILT